MSATHHLRPTGRDRPSATEAGTGLIGTTAGVVVFLVLLLFAVQVAYDLSATSATTAVALDAARMVASHDVDHADPASVATAEARAEARARAGLGRVGRRARFDWAVGPDVVRLRIRLRAPRFVPPGLDRAVGFDEVDRTVVVRVERLR